MSLFLFFLFFSSIFLKYADIVKKMSFFS